MAKICSACGREKPLDAFYAQRTADGRMGCCKECHKERARQRRRLNPAVQQYDRERAKTPKRRDLSARVAARWRLDHPDAYRAQTAVNNAVRDGRLSKEPCLFCRAPDVHAHHRDYNKPLEVIWLCPKCHHRLHHAFPETAAHGERAA